MIAAVIPIAAGGTASAATATFPNTPVAGDRVNGVGWASLVVGNTVYVGGTFTSVRDQAGTTVAARANLAAFDATTGRLRTTFRADTNGQVADIAYDGTNLYVVGGFTTVNGVSRGRVAALDPASGAVRTTWVANATGQINAVAIGGGALYVGGSFGSIAGVARSRVAALRRSDGAVLTGFSTTVNATVYAMGAQPDGSTVYVGGGFTTVNGANRPYLVAVSGASGGLATPTFSGVSGLTDDIDVPPGGTRLAVGTAGYGNQAAWFSLSSGSKLWRQRCDGDVQAVKVFGDLLYSGFHEGCEGDTTVRMAANATSNGARITSFRPTFDRFYGVRDIDGTSTVMAIAGDFNRVGGVAAQGFAIFRSTG
ncbi:MAG: hypothetical protein ACKOYM_01475 [Actinomycetes bacterium]